MDTSETYIKMCEKAWPDLKRELEINDIVYSRRAERLCIVRPALDGKAEQYLTTILLDKPISLQADDFFIVWDQDQLQEMMGNRPNHPWDLAYVFGLFCHPWKRIKAQFSGFPAEYYEDGIAPDPLPEIVLNQGQLDYPKKFTSMEQLWLAFTMRENYNKVWSGEDWSSQS